MINKSKGDYAYTIMDLDHEVNDDIIKELEGLENVLKVRKIG
jgi:D-3-phosphoglycerate dehydrogenase